MMEVGAVGVRLDLAGGQAIKTHAFGIIVNDIKFWKFLGQKADGLAVRAPEGLARGIGKLAAVSAVDVHDPETAHGVAAFAGIDGEAELRAVRRDLGVMFVNVGRLGKGHRAGAVGIADENFPVVVRITFISDFERQGRQAVFEGGLGARRGSHDQAGSEDLQGCGGTVINRAKRPARTTKQVVL